MSESLTIATPDTKHVETQAHEIAAAAKSIQVADAGSYASAGEFLRRVKSARQVLAATFDGAIRKAHEAHKAMLAAKNMHDAPLTEAENLVKRKMSAWSQEQERIRREEEARLRQEALRRAEEERLAQAEALEAQGQQEAAEAILDVPVAAAPVVVPKSVPKVEGVYETKRWTFEVVNEDLIPREYMMPDTTKIGQYARMMGDKAQMPGVEFKQVTSQTVRS